MTTNTEIAVSHVSRDVLRAAVKTGPFRSVKYSRAPSKSRNVPKMKNVRYAASMDAMARAAAAAATYISPGRGLSRYFTMQMNMIMVKQARYMSSRIKREK